MGKTYSHLPIAVPDIFSALVAKVQTNLAGEGTLSIPQVNFMHGTWMDISQELREWSKAQSSKNIKFPLVCLLYKVDEKFVDPFEPEINVNILICTDSVATYSNDDRYEVNIKPILYPIYAELKSVIGTSMYFTGYNRRFEHGKIDLPHAGQESSQGPVAYELPDVIDGIMMQGVKLKVAMSRCPYVAPNLCRFTQCPYGLETYYENIFKNVTFTGVGTAVLSASVNAYDFVSIGPGLPPPFAPEIDWFGDGSFVAMDVPTPPALAPFTASINLAVSNPYGDGVFRGVIKNGDATVEFYYKVLGGIIVKMISEIEQAVEYSVSCPDYPNYPATISGSITWVRDGQTEPFTMNGYSLSVFGQTKATESFAATDTYSKTTVTTLIHMGSNQSIVNNFSFTGQGGQTPLAMTSIYRTRCKTSFD